MESGKNVNYIVLAFVFLIIGVALIGQVAINTENATDKTTVVDEAIDLSGVVLNPLEQVNESASNFTVTFPPTGWKVTECALTSVGYGNSTGDYTLDTDYELYPAQGIIHVLNTTTTASINGGNNTLIDYTYCPDDYLNSSWGRTVLDLIPGFFALALLGVALWLFYMVFRENKIIS